MSNPLLRDCVQGHTRMLRRLDARARQLAGYKHEVLTPAERLASSQVYLVAGGEVGLRTAKRLAELGLGYLTMAGVTVADQTALRDTFPPGARKDCTVLPRTYDIYASALQLGMHQLIVFAASRPHPTVQSQLNEAAVRLGLPFVQTALFAHEAQLGPTVIPGATACHACYQTRLRANYSRLDVPQARDRFLDRNPEFQFAGHLTAVDDLAATLAATEVDRVLSNHAPPLALSAEISVNALSQTRQKHFVPYVEWCEVCHVARTPQNDMEFSDFVRNISR